MQWEKIRMELMVLEWNFFYQKAKKFSKNDADMLKQHRNQPEATSIG